MDKNQIGPEGAMKRWRRIVPYVTLGLAVLLLVLVMFDLAVQLLLAKSAISELKTSQTANAVTQMEPLDVLAMPVAVTTPAPPPSPCPISEDEITLLAKVLYRECQVLYWRGAQFGVSYQARQAAVAWCALNRLDSPDFPNTLTDVLLYPNAFSYTDDTPVTDELLWLARDVVNRWWAEKQGAENVGRTLPKSYTFFRGVNSENHFRNAFTEPYTIWDWSLPDPYV